VATVGRRLGGGDDGEVVVRDRLPTRFVIETGLWLATVVWMSSRGVRWLRRKSVQHWLERATGVVLVGFGVGLATEAH
jgi:threonine/homoserine/homoserine lactone efflux protein